jgi:hypothetical protein
VGFPIESQQGAVGVVDGGGVVIEAGAAMLEQRGHQHDAEFARQQAQAVGDGPRQRIRQIEAGRILHGAEIRCEEQFLGDHNPRARRRRLPDQRLVVGERLGFGRESAGLEQGKAWHRAECATPGPRGQALRDLIADC